MENKVNKQIKTKELFNKIIDGVDNIVSSGEYSKFLRFTKVLMAQPMSLPSSPKQSSSCRHFTPCSPSIED